MVERDTIMQMNETCCAAAADEQDLTLQKATVAGFSRNQQPCVDKNYAHHIYLMVAVHRSFLLLVSSLGTGTGARLFQVNPYMFAHLQSV